MLTLSIITSIAILFSIFLLFKKPKTKYLEKGLIKIHFAFLVFAMVTIYLLMQDLRFIGRYTNPIIGLMFLTSGIILFGITTSKGIKIYTGFIAIPALVIQVSLLFGKTPFYFPALIGYLMFAPPQQKEKINDRYHLEVREGGLMAPLNLFYLTRRTGFIFDKQIPLTSSAGFLNISKLQVISFKENENIVCKFYDNKLNNKFSIDTLRYEK